MGDGYRRVNCSNEFSFCDKKWKIFCKVQNQNCTRNFLMTVFWCVCYFWWTFSNLLILSIWRYKERRLIWFIFFEFLVTAIGGKPKPELCKLQNKNFAPFPHLNAFPDENELDVNEGVLEVMKRHISILGEEIRTTSLTWKIFKSIVVL